MIARRSFTLTPASRRRLIRYCIKAGASGGFVAGAVFASFLWLSGLKLVELLV